MKIIFIIQNGSSRFQIQKGVFHFTPIRDLPKSIQQTILLKCIVYFVHSGDGAPTSIGSIKQNIDKFTFGRRLAEDKVR